MSAGSTAQVAKLTPGLKLKSEYLRGEREGGLDRGRCWPVSEGS